MPKSQDEAEKLPASGNHLRYFFVSACGEYISLQLDLFAAISCKPNFLSSAATTLSTAYHTTFGHWNRNRQSLQTICFSTISISSGWKLTMCMCANAQINVCTYNTKPVNPQFSVHTRTNVGQTDRIWCKVYQLSGFHRTLSQLNALVCRFQAMNNADVVMPLVLKVVFLVPRNW